MVVKDGEAEDSDVSCKDKACRRAVKEWIVERIMAEYDESDDR